MNIYIANLPFKTKEADLKELFEKHGTVDSVKIVTDRETGRSRGFGFVEMSDESEGKKAIAALNGYTLNTRDLVVNEARERSK